MRNIAKILLVSFCLIPAMAGAQTARKPAAQQPAVLTGDLIQDAKNGFKGDPNDPSAGVKLTGNIKKDALAVWKQIQAASKADLQYASLMAGAAGTPAAGTRQMCWDAIIKVNEQSNGGNH